MHRHHEIDGIHLHLSQPHEAIGEWIGQGTATCLATMSCLQGAGELPAIADCMAAARPDVSAAASAVLRCMVSAQDPESECSAQIEACSAL